MMQTSEETAAMRRRTTSVWVRTLAHALAIAAAVPPAAERHILAELYRAAVCGDWCRSLG